MKLGKRKMFKFISPKSSPLILEQNIIEVDEDLSPIKEILRKNDFSNYSFVLGENDANAISLADAFQFQVNVKSVGTFHFLFRSEGFRKDDLISKVSTLKDMTVDSSESAQDKVEALIAIVNQFQPLFAVFKESDDSYYHLYLLEETVNNAFPVLIVRVEINRDIDEFNIGGDEFEAAANNPEKKKKVARYSKERIIKDVAKNKFSLLLIFVSTVLLEVSIPLAILNIYAKNALYIFLFICGTIGMSMNTYCYVDYFRNRNIKNPLFLFSVASNIIGVGVGTGVFAIFYNISTKAEGTPSIGSFILIGLLVSFILIAATIAIVYFIPRKNKAK